MTGNPVDRANEKLKISDIAEFSPVDVARLIAGLANHDIWALEVVETQTAEGVFDLLAPYWMGLSYSQRIAVVDGCLLYFDQIGNVPADDQQMPPGLRDALAFCVNIIPDLDLDHSHRFFRPMRFWIRNGNEPERRLAAAAFASINSIEALRILEAEARHASFASWILPALLERRSKSEPRIIFADAEQWLGSASDDIRARSALQHAFQRMVAADREAAARGLSDTTGKLNEADQKKLKSVVEEAGHSDLLNVSQPPAHGVAPAPPSLGPLGDLLQDLGRIHSEGLQGKPTNEIAEDWRLLLHSLPSDRRARRPKWKLITTFAEDTAPHAPDDRFLSGLRAAIFGRPAERPFFELLREAQREFYEARLRPPRAADQAWEIIKGRLEGRITTLRTIQSGKYPRELRIPTVIYAEEVYMETLRLLLGAYFPELDVERISGVDWDQLDSKIKHNVCDLGLNNDDILSHPGGPATNLVRLNGPPLYTSDKFLVLARRDFLTGLGGAFTAVCSREIQDDCLFSGLSREALIALFTSLMTSGRVSVPKETLLHTTMAKFVQDLGLTPDECISAEPSDKGLIDFFAGEVEMYFGGSLQTSYALRTWKEAVPVCMLGVPGVEGRLFARSDLCDDFPDFMQDLADLTTEIRYALGPVPAAAYQEALRYHLVEDLNSALFESSPHNVTVVENYDQLASALVQSELQRSKPGERQWKPWSPGEDQTGSVSLRLIEGAKK